MDRIQRHPFTAASVLAGCLVLLIAAVVRTHYVITPTGNDIQVWGGTAPTVGDISTSSQSMPSSPPPSQFVQTDTTRTFNIVSPQQTDTTANSNGPSDQLDSLLAQLVSQTSSKTTPQKSNASNGLANAYAFVPQGLTSVPAITTENKTPAQQELYTYGNEVGSYIQSFETQHPNESQILTDQLQSRNDPQKNAAVIALGNALISLGTQIANIDPVPSSVVGYHTALADGYKAIGKKLVLVPAAGDNAALLAAVNTYNSTADSFIASYGALATYFSFAGVRFSSSDPGSVFTFSASMSL